MSDTQLPDIGMVSTTEIEGLRIRFAKGGAAIGVPVLLTAPWPESIYAFHRLLPVLGKKHPYIAVDLPGYGLSDSRPEVMSPAAMGDFIVPLMKHFGLKRAHVVAPDVGTLAFLFAASARPDLFESLVIGGGAVRAELAADNVTDLVRQGREPTRGKLFATDLEKQLAIHVRPSPSAPSPGRRPSRRRRQAVAPAECRRFVRSRRCCCSNRGC